MGLILLFRISEENYVIWVFILLQTKMLRAFFFCRGRCFDAQYKRSLDRFLETSLLPAVSLGRKYLYVPTERCHKYIKHQYNLTLQFHNTFVFFQAVIPFYLLTKNLFFFLIKRVWFHFNIYPYLSSVTCLSPFPKICF